MEASVGWAPPFSILSLPLLAGWVVKGLQVPGILLWLWPIILAATRAERDLVPHLPVGRQYLGDKDPWVIRNGACRFFELRYSSTLDTLEGGQGPNLLYSFSVPKNPVWVLDHLSVSVEILPSTITDPKSNTPHKRLLHPVQLYI